MQIRNKPMEQSETTANPLARYPSIGNTEKCVSLLYTFFLNECIYEFMYFKLFFHLDSNITLMCEKYGKKFHIPAVLSMGTILGNTIIASVLTFL